MAKMIVLLFYVFSFLLILSFVSHSFLPISFFTLSSFLSLFFNPSLLYLLSLSSMFLNSVLYSSFRKIHAKTFFYTCDNNVIAGIAIMVSVTKVVSIITIIVSLAMIVIFPIVKCCNNCERRNNYEHYIICDCCNNSDSENNCQNLKNYEIKIMVIFKVFSRIAIFIVSRIVQIKTKAIHLIWMQYLY